MHILTGLPIPNTMFQKYKMNAVVNKLLLGDTFMRKMHLTLSWRRTLSYRNQPIDLLCKWKTSDSHDLLTVLVNHWLKIKKSKII